MFDQNFRASSIVMSSRIAGTHSIHHGLNDFIERLRAIFEEQIIDPHRTALRGHFPIR
jgi:hypothetical protein